MTLVDSPDCVSSICSTLDSAADLPVTAVRRDSLYLKELSHGVEERRLGQEGQAKTRGG